MQLSSITWGGEVVGVKYNANILKY